MLGCHTCGRRGGGLSHRFRAERQALSRPRAGCMLSRAGFSKCSKRPGVRDTLDYCEDSLCMLHAGSSGAPRQSGRPCRVHVQQPVRHACTKTSLRDSSPQLPDGSISRNRNACERSQVRLWSRAFVVGQPSQQHMHSNNIQPGSPPPVSGLEIRYAHTLYATLYAQPLPPAAAYWVSRQATPTCPGPFAHAFSGTAAPAAGQSPRAARPARPPVARRRGPGSPCMRGSRMRARRRPGGTLPGRRPARHRPRPPR